MAKVNVDENPETPARLGIRAIPTMILFDDGEPKEKVIAVKPKSRLIDLISPYVN